MIVNWYLAVGQLGFRASQLYPNMGWQDSGVGRLI